MKSYRQMSFIAGILAVICYLEFAFLAYTKYSLSLIFSQLYWLEWVTVGLFLAYTGLLGFNTKRLETSFVMAASSTVS